MYRISFELLFEYTCTQPALRPDSELPVVTADYRFPEIKAIRTETVQNTPPKIAASIGWQLHSVTATVTSSEFSQVVISISIVLTDSAKTRQQSPMINVLMVKLAVVLLLHA